MEQSAYWKGFAAGRRFEQKHNGAALPTPQSAAAATTQASDAPATPAPLPSAISPAPLPSNGYVPKGRAQPLSGD
jgi:hypothetical protein